MAVASVNKARARGGPKTSAPGPEESQIFLVLLG